MSGHETDGPGGAAPRRAAQAPGGPGELRLGSAALGTRREVAAAARPGRRRRGIVLLAAGVLLALVGGVSFATLYLREQQVLDGGRAGTFALDRGGHGHGRSGADGRAAGTFRSADGALVRHGARLPAAEDAHGLHAGVPVAARGELADEGRAAAPLVVRADAAGRRDVARDGLGGAGIGVAGLAVAGMGVLGLRAAKGRPARTAVRRTLAACAAAGAASYVAGSALTGAPWS